MLGGLAESSQLGNHHEGLDSVEIDLHRELPEAGREGGLSFLCGKRKKTAIYCIS
jgi:hypothetical protein